MIDLRAKELQIGRVASSPFFAKFALQLGGVASDGAQNWLRQFSERVMGETLNDEDKEIIARCEASSRIARSLGFPDSDLNAQQLDEVMARLREVYPPPDKEEDADS